VEKNPNEDKEEVIFIKYNMYFVLSRGGDHVC
jgi:hypothetical protein